MTHVKIASFNVWGIDGKDVTPAVEAAVALAGPAHPELLAVGFQEVWFNHQLATVTQAFIDSPIASGTARPVSGAPIASRSFVGVDCRSNPAKPGWKCLVPRAGAAGVPGIRHFDLGSGLVLCVRGTVRDAFFSRFRGGYVPDSFAHKGMLAAWVAPPAGRPYAIVNTHFHDFSNDAHGGARRNNLEQLASVLKWIAVHWRIEAIVIGDFNIDSRSAYLSPTPTVEAVLYQRLLSLTKPAGKWWRDVNAHVSQNKPVPTQASQQGAIDLLLLSEGSGRADYQFQALITGPAAKPFSDHRLTVGSWREV